MRIQKKKRGSDKDPLSSSVRRRRIKLPEVKLCMGRACEGIGIPSQEFERSGSKRKKRIR